MIDKELRKRVAEAERGLRKELQYVSDFIYKNPEIGMEEHLACGLLCDAARTHGFRIVKPFCDMDTAFLAELNNGPGPVIAFLAEYDALPGFGPNNGPGHACGHNWIAATTLGTALTLAELRDCFSGTVRLIGTPAMENFSGKVAMVARHAFDGVDAAMQPHLERLNCIEYKTLAMDPIEFTFRGKASHAALYPEQAINALNAAQFTFIGLNALKNQMRRDVNIHGVITEGGKAASTITEHAVCQFYVRALDRAYLDKVTKRVIRCAEGAALMAEAEMSWRFFEDPCDNLILNDAFRELTLEYWGAEGLEPGRSYRHEIALSSGDIGNVSRACPTMYMEFDIGVEDEFRIHDATAMKYVNSPCAYDKMDQVIRIMAGTALELYRDKDRLAEIKRAHKENVSAETEHE